MIQDKQINGFSKLKSLPRILSKWIHLLSNLKLLSTLTRQTTTRVLLIFSQNNLEVICYNPSIFIYARLMLSKHCFVNSIIISSPKLNLNISILLSRCTNLNQIPFIILLKHEQSRVVSTPPAHFLPRNDADIYDLMQEPTWPPGIMYTYFTVSQLYTHKEG